MTDRPIIFSAGMIRALLDGRKSMTRRILKPQPDTESDPSGMGAWGAKNRYGYWIPATGIRPYAPGQRLWVREVFAYGWPVEGNHQLPECNQAHAITYRADGNRPFGGGRWHSPIHMPRWASRLTLVVSDVRVQRVQDISEADAVAEGIEPGRRLSCGGMSHTAVDIFCDIWNSLHGPGAWDRNDWVAALTFTVHRCNIDQMGGNHE